MLINPYSYPSLIIQDIIISSDATNLNIRTLLDNTGWDGNKAMQATITINSGIKVGSSSTSTPAIVTGDLTNAEVTLIVSSGAYVVGAGGNGGAGGNWNRQIGQIGGNAIQATSALIIDNLGTIGGGGGGGCTDGWVSQSGWAAGSGGGGGGAGYVAGLGSTGSAWVGGTMPPQPGGNGTLTSGGVGGQYGYHPEVGYGSYGGNGGSLGAASTGGQQSLPTSAGGYYLVGSSNVTWINTGTRLGSAS